MTEKECLEFSYGDLILEFGLLFINKPYKAATLEVTSKEKLVVNLSAFDCLTFVETVLALVRCYASGKNSFSEFEKNLKLIRYRNGKIAGYSSRLHYFIDWLRDNEKKGVLTDLSRQLGGNAKHKKIDFMTTHRKLYPALENKTQRTKIFMVEKDLSRKAFHVIGRNKINSLNEKIRNGDVVAFAAKQEGLDVAHVGFALRQGKSLRLFHASSKEGKVVISKNSLGTYLKSNKKFTGIIVARFLRND